MKEGKEVMRLHLTKLLGRWFKDDTPLSYRKRENNSLVGGGSSVTLTKCNFIGNHAGWYGGAIYNDGDLMVGYEGEPEEESGFMTAKDFFG